MNGKDGGEQEASTDTTAQEKNISYPSDSKLHQKMVRQCVAIDTREDIELCLRHAHDEEIINGTTLQQPSKK